MFVNIYGYFQWQVILLVCARPLAPTESHFNVYRSASAQNRDQARTQAQPARGGPQRR